MPGYGLALVIVKLKLSVPKKRAKIKAQAEHSTEWSDNGYGWRRVRREVIDSLDGSASRDMNSTPDRRRFAGCRHKPRCEWRSPAARSCSGTWRHSRRSGNRRWQDAARRKGARYPIG